MPTIAASPVHRMLSAVRRVAVGLLGLIVSIVAIVLSVRSVDLAEVARALSEANPAFLVAGIGLVGVGVVLRALRWQRLLVPVDNPPPDLRRITPVLLIGYLGNTILPARMGEPIRAYLLARREHLNGFEVFGTVLLERVLDVAVLAILAFAAAVWLDPPEWILQLTGVAAAVGGTIVVVTTIIGAGAVQRWLDRLSSQASGLPARVAKAASRVLNGFAGAARRRPAGEATAITAVVWLVDAAICVLVAASLGSTLSLATGLLIVGVGALATSIPSAPGYIGTYELAASAAAQAVGLSPENALSLAILLHAVTLLPVVVAGIVSMIALEVGGLTSLAREARHHPGTDEGVA